MFSYVVAVITLQKQTSHSSKVDWAYQNFFMSQTVSYISLFFYVQRAYGYQKRIPSLINCTLKEMIPLLLFPKLSLKGMLTTVVNYSLKENTQQ
jgi:hypothetical protein